MNTQNSNLRIGFMGTPDFALAALKSLLAAGYNIVCVYSQPPRPKGRGQQVQLSPVHAYALEQGIQVFTPHSLKSPEAQNEFASHNLDVAVVAAYGLILPEAVLQAPKFGCLNIHASLLPRWRGAAPIQYSIWKGDHETGVTIMQMEKGLDTGPMIVKEVVAITEKTTTSSLHDELAEIGGKLIVSTLDQLAIKGPLEAEMQDNALTNYAHMLKKSDGVIDWSEPAENIDRQIRALNPWPGVWSEMKDLRIKILKAAPLELENTENVLCGVLINRDGHVTCGHNSILAIQQVQPEGKKPMDIISAINGGYLVVGEKFN